MPYVSLFHMLSVLSSFSHSLGKSAWDITSSDQSIKIFWKKKMSLGVIHRAFITWKKKYLDQLKLNHYVVYLQLQNVRQPLERSKGILEYLSFETKLEIFSNFEMLKVNVFEGKMSETWFVEIPLVKASTSIEAHRVSGKMRDRVEHFYVSSPSLIHLP